MVLRFFVHYLIPLLLREAPAPGDQLPGIIPIRAAGKSATTHSLQQPNQTSGVTGGNPQMIGTIAKSAVAAGADGLFIETHPNPAVAKSDGANMLRLDLLKDLLQQLVRIRKAVI